jgi:MoxR-like ATPase
MPNTQNGNNEMKPRHQAHLASQFNAYLDHLRQAFIGLDREIEMLAIGLLIRKNVAFIGSYGEGKSALIKEFAKGISKSYYGIQFNPHTTPDEFIGHFSLREMEKNDQLIRKIDGKIGTCQIFYCDEFANGGTGTQNALLEAINEKTIDLGNGTKKQIPLEMAIGSTNRDISKIEALDAFWDRWALRSIIDKSLDTMSEIDLMTYVNGVHKAVPTIGRIPLDARLNPKILDELRSYIYKVNLNPLASKINKLVQYLKEKKIQISARRLKWCLEALAAKALIDGRLETEPEDLIVLNQMLWTHKEDREMIKMKIMELSWSPLEDLKKSLRTIKAKIAEADKADQEIQKCERKMRAQKHAALDELIDKVYGLIKDVNDSPQWDRTDPHVADLINKINAYENFDKRYQ